MPYGHEKSVGVVRSADEVLDRLDGNPGGDLARRVSAHAVGDDEQPQILGADEAVLVDPANGAGLAQAECDHDSRSGGVYHVSGWTYYFSGSDTTKVVVQHPVAAAATRVEIARKLLASGQLADQLRPRVDADLLEDPRQVLLRRRRRDAQRQPRSGCSAVPRSTSSAT